MKKVLLLVIVFTTAVFYAQKNETCNSPAEESLIDLSSITKCSVETSKKSKSKRSRQISVRVSASKRRFLKKRNVKKNTASSIDNLSTSGIADTGSSNIAAKSLELRNSVANLTNTLSATQVRTAERFTTVDEIPTFVECKGVKKSEQSDCFNTEMIKHIQRHFSYPSEAVIKKIQGDVWVRFVIDTNGNVTNIKTLGPENGELLNLEAKRVVSKLPTFIPATKKGKKAPVKYGFPINFSLE